MDVGDYQEDLKDRLSRIFREDKIKIKIRKSMGISRGTYSPHIDVTVGPFAVEREYQEKYGEMLSKHDDLIEKLKRDAINSRYIDFDKNQNPRCFMGIEIEKSTEEDIKHMLGSITNASFLAKVGVVIAFSNDAAIRRLHSLFKFVQKVGKVENYPFENVILTNKKTFDEILNSF